VDEKRENRLLCPPADSQPESLGSKRSVPRTHPEHSLTLMGDSTTKSAAVMTTLSFSYTTVLLIRLCGIRYSQLSARDSMPSAMTAEDTGALRQRQNRIMKPMALQRSSVPARSPMPLLSPVPMAVSCAQLHAALHGERQPFGAHRSCGDRVSLLRMASHASKGGDAAQQSRGPNCRVHAQHLPHRSWTRPQIIGTHLLRRLRRESGPIVQNSNRLSYERTVLCMTLDEAREEIISGIDYAASRED